MAPQEGEIRLGTNLEIAYFDQLRSQLDENKSVLDNVGQGRDVISINGRNRNLYGYLEDFLFSKERVHAPISALSGGERNRLLLARLFTQPANLLVMDEPTNDLDIETLEILENLLLDYEGTLLLVSHDRGFINNLVSSTIVLDDHGNVREFVGGYDDWQQQIKAQKDLISENKETKKPDLSSQKSNNIGKTNDRGKISYKERRELEARKRELEELPSLIEKLESEQQSLANEMAAPAFYQQDNETIAATALQLQKLEEDLNNAYQRWGELEDS